MGYLKKQSKKEVFNPSYFSIWYNPFYIIRKSLYRGIKKYSKYMSGTMLDFGCGSKPYKELFHVKKYIGLEIEDASKEKYNNDADVYYNGINIPFKDNKFDSILSTEVFEHIFNLDIIIKELNRILKVNGYIIATVPFVWNEHGAPYDFARYTSFGLKYIFENNGFKVVEYCKCTNYIETLFQMSVEYIRLMLPNKKLYRYALSLLLIFPLNLLGIVLGKVFPCDYSLYNTAIVVAKKVE